MKARNAIGLSTGDPDEFVPAGRFPLFLALCGAIVATTAAIAFVTDRVSRAAPMIALTLTAALVGALAGFLVGSPGMQPTEDGKAAGYTKGWAGRIGVLGNALTGALLAVTVANFDEIKDFIRTVLMYATGAEHKQAPTRETRQLVVTAGLMVVWGVIGFITGFMQMVTNGRSVITASDERQRRREERLAAPPRLTLITDPSSPITARTAAPVNLTLTVKNEGKRTVRLNGASDGAPGLSLMSDSTRTDTVATPWTGTLIESGAGLATTLKVTPKVAGPWSVDVVVRGSFEDQTLTIAGVAT